MLKGYIFICRNAEGVHGKKKVGNPCSIQSIYRHTAIERISATDASYKNFHYVKLGPRSLIFPCEKMHAQTRRDCTKIDLVVSTLKVDKSFAGVEATGVQSELHGFIVHVWPVGMILCSKSSGTGATVISVLGRYAARIPRKVNWQPKKKQRRLKKVSAYLARM